MNENFNVPNYIQEELLEYRINNTSWENVNCILNLAVFNNRISREQAISLKEKYKEVI